MYLTAQQQDPAMRGFLFYDLLAGVVKQSDAAAGRFKGPSADP